MINPTGFVRFIYNVILSLLKLILEYVIPFVALFAIIYMIYLWKFKKTSKDDLLEIKKGVIKIAKRNKILSYAYLKKFYRVEIDVARDIINNDNLTEDDKEKRLRGLRYFKGGIPIGEITGFAVMDLIVTEEDLVSHQLRMKRKLRKKIDEEDIKTRAKTDLDKAGRLVYIVVYKKKKNMFSSFESPVLLLEEQISDPRCKSGDLACYGLGFQPFAGFEIVSGDIGFRDILSLHFMNWSREHSSFSMLASTTDFVRKATGMDTDQTKTIEMATALGGIKRMQEKEPL